MPIMSKLYGRTTRSGDKVRITVAPGAAAMDLDSKQVMGPGEQATIYKWKHDETPSLGEIVEPVAPEPPKGKAEK